MGRVGEYTEPLAELRWHWGSAYLITHPRLRTWLAERRDDRTVLRAESADDLLNLIRDDYRDRPVSRLRHSPRAAPTAVVAG
jgi:hypothetical protein